MPVPIFPIDFLEVLKGCNKVSLEPSLFQAEQPQLSQLFLIGEVLQHSDYFCGLLWTRSNSSMSFLCWGLQSWTQDCRWGLTRAEQRGRIPSLALLATLLLMQPRVWLAFWAASARWWLMSSLWTLYESMDHFVAIKQSLFQAPCVMDSYNECILVLISFPFFASLIFFKINSIFLLKRSFEQHRCSRHKIRCI